MRRVKPTSSQALVPPSRLSSTAGTTLARQGDATVHLYLSSRKQQNFGPDSIKPFIITNNSRTLIYPPTAPSRYTLTSQITRYRVQYLFFTAIGDRSNGCRIASSQKMHQLLVSTPVLPHRPDRLFRHCASSLHRTRRNRQRKSAGHSAATDGLCGWLRSVQALAKQQCDRRSPKKISGSSVWTYSQRTRYNYSVRCISFRVGYTMQVDKV